MEKWTRILNIVQLVIMVYIIALISIMLGAFAQYLLKVGVQQVIWYKDEGFYTLMSGLINMRLLSGILC